MKTHEKLKKEIKDLIGANKTGIALKLLAEKQLPSIEQELILISSRFSKVTTEQRLGISEEDDIQRKFNKINFDLLALIESIGTKPVSLQASPSGAKSNSKKYFFIAGGLLLTLLIVWGIMQTMQRSQTLPEQITIKKDPVVTPSDTVKESNIDPIEIPDEETSQEEENTNITFKVGMEHEGGKVFFVDSTGKHGLIMATIDMPEGEIYWQNNDGPVEKAGATASDLYTGRLNTKDIIEKFGPGNYPAQLCDKYSRRGFSDWYLPSIMELEKLYEYSLSHSNELSKLYYWSSTEISASNKDVFYKNFRTGDVYDRLPKYNNYTNQNKALVRAVRSF